MRALRLHGDRDLRLEEVAPPPPPGPGEVQIRVRAVSLNHIDVWGWRGMALAQRQLPLIVGAEASGEVVAVGEGVSGWSVGDRATPYGARTCGSSTSSSAIRRDSTCAGACSRTRS